MIKAIAACLCAAVFMTNVISVQNPVPSGDDRAKQLESMIDWLTDTFSDAYKYYSETAANTEDGKDSVKKEETKSAETKPAEKKTTETKPAEIKPAEKKTTETKPAETKPAEKKTTETKPAETKPAEKKTTETKPAETKQAETKPAESEASSEQKKASDAGKESDEKTPDFGEALLSSWNEKSDFLKTIEEFAEKAADKESDGFIPASDRIAVFDFEGTLFSRNLPADLDTMLLLHRALDDNSYNAPKEIRNLAVSLKEELPAAFDDTASVMKRSMASGRAFAGMTLDEYESYVKKFLKNPAEGFTGLKLKDGWYQPMLEAVKYLTSRGFEVYIVTGSDRYTVRAAADGYLDLPASHIIGSDVNIVSSEQGFDEGYEYDFCAEDELVRGDRLVYKNMKANKTASVIREIGKKPVLAFCSADDLTLAEITKANGDYESEVFVISQDDDAREYTDVKAASELQKKAEEKGYHTISVKNDWKKVFAVETEKTESED